MDLDGRPPLGPRITPSKVDVYATDPPEPST
jgi:hypothetical protein